MSDQSTFRARSDLARESGRILEAVRAGRPLIHHITNFVTMTLAANVTLAAGALPVMAHAREEAEEMAGSADALVLNLGTLWPEQVQAMLLAGRCASSRGIPVVLDPVGAGATRLRTESARRLLDELSIAIVRGNAAELGVLAGAGGKISGVEAVDVQGDSAATAVALARRYGCVAAVTGAVDVVTDGRRLLRISNGDPVMRSSTGTGCMATAVTACFAAVERDSVLAAGAALAVYGLAGEMAARTAQGPGTLPAHLLDSLAGLTVDTIHRGARIVEEEV